MIKICPKCHQEYDSKNKFCPYCGAKNEIDEPKTNKIEVVDNKTLPNGEQPDFIKTDKDQQFVIKIQNKLKNNLITFICCTSILFLYLLSATLLPFVHPSSSNYANIIQVFISYVEAVLSGGLFSSPSNMNHLMIFFMLLMFVLVSIGLLINVFLDIFTGVKFLKNVKNYTLDAINFINSNINEANNVSASAFNFDYKKKTLRLSIKTKVNEIITVTVLFVLLVITFYIGIEIDIAIFFIPLLFFIGYLVLNIIYMIFQGKINKEIKNYINENFTNFK